MPFSNQSGFPEQLISFAHCLHVSLTEEQVKKGDQLWSNLTPQQRNNPKVIQDIISDLMFNTKEAQTEDTPRSFTKLDSQNSAKITSLMYSVKARALSEGLKNWHSEGDVAEAQCRIINAFAENSISLNLSDLGLTSIPPEIALLSDLNTLNLSNNKLTSLPPELAQMKNLNYLYLSKNQLSDVPSEICQLVNLKHLFLSNNQLQTIPSEIGQLEKLTMLYLEENQLTSLPFELGELNNLLLLDISNNPSLASLPFSLSKNTRVLSKLEVVDRTKPPSELEKFFKGSGLKLDQFTENQKEKIEELILNLQQTIGFNQNEDFKLIVLNILKTVTSDDEFRRAFFTHLETNHLKSYDTSSTMIYEIYGLWKIHTLPKDTPLKDQLSILVGIAKAITLHEGIEQRIDKQEQLEGFKEILQIYHHYEINLSEVLKLVTPLQNMKDDGSGFRDWMNKDDLIEHVNSTYFKTLFEMPIFQKLFREHLKAEIELIDIQFHQELELLKAPIAPEESPEMLNYQFSQGQIMQERNQNQQELAQEWVSSQLT